MGKKGIHYVAICYYIVAKKVKEGGIYIPQDNFQRNFNTYNDSICTDSDFELKESSNTS